MTDRTTTTPTPDTPTAPKVERWRFAERYGVWVVYDSDDQKVAICSEQATAARICMLPGLVTIAGDMADQVEGGIGEQSPETQGVLQTLLRGWRQVIARARGGES